MCLTGFMVGILTEYDDLHLVEGCVIEGVEDEAAGRVAWSGSIFSLNELYELFEVRLLKLKRELVLPALFYIDFSHNYEL